jgi:hypothetical protein
MTINYNIKIITFIISINFIYFNEVNAKILNCTTNQIIKTDIINGLFQKNATTKDYFLENFKIDTTNNIIITNNYKNSYFQVEYDYEAMKSFLHYQEKFNPSKKQNEKMIIGLFKIYPNQTFTYQKDTGDSQIGKCFE